MEGLHRQRVRVVKEMDLKSIGLARAGSNPAVVDALLLHVHVHKVGMGTITCTCTTTRYPRHPTSKNFVSDTIFYF